MLEPCITSPAWVSWISDVRLVLVLICCSTLENCTSSVVNWLVSNGLVGSWFCSCVISKLRKSPKLEDSEFKAVLPVDAAALVPAAAAETADALAAAAVFCCAVTEARLIVRVPSRSGRDIQSGAQPRRQSNSGEFRVGVAHGIAGPLLRIAVLSRCSARAAAR